MIHVSNAKYVISKVDFTSSFPVNNETHVYEENQKADRCTRINNAYTI